MLSRKESQEFATVSPKSASAFVVRDGSCLNPVRHRLAGRQRILLKGEDHHAGSS
jgi:hypothetical protein